jgi:ribonuclease P protein component
MTATFPSTHRIQKQEDFDRIYQARLYAADDWLVVNGCTGDLPHPRLGLSVSKRVGNAVIRNRWKRLIREAFRLSREELPPALDIVVRPQKDAQPELEPIKKSLVSLAHRIANRIAQRDRKLKTENRKPKTEN